MQTVADMKLITCIIPRGLGSDLVDALHEEKELTAVNVAHGRGISRRGGYFAQEVDILTVIVAASAADNIFAYLYDRIDIEGSSRRFLFQESLGCTTDFVLPDSVEEEQV
ncbi:MAG: hypothetical protein ACJZ9F_03800 [Rhodospirillaceae bacterium]